MTGGLSTFKKYCESMKGSVEHDAHWSTSQGRVEHHANMYGNEGAYETLHCQIGGKTVLQMTQEVLKGVNDITLTVISGEDEVGVVHFADDVRVNVYDLNIFKDGEEVAHVECSPKHKVCSLVVIAGPDKRQY